LAEEATGDDDGMRLKIEILCASRTAFSYCFKIDIFVI
jgi:hypothetical protein